MFSSRTKQPINGSSIEVTVKGEQPVNLNSDATGKFASRLPETDEFVIKAGADGFQPYSGSFPLPKISKDTLINVEIFLDPQSMSMTISGVVYNDKTKAVLPGSTVAIGAKGFSVIDITSNDEGRFSRLFSQPRDYTISASASGFQPFSSAYRAPKIKKDTTINVDVFLTPDLIKLVVNGTVTNKKTGAKINAKVTITKQGDDALNFNPATDSGGFSQELPSTGMYYFTASQGGFLNTTDSLNYDNEEVTPMTKNLVLQPIEVGVVVRLKNIYFDYNKATLKKESFVELEKVVTFLNENPTVEIEIEGHTDSDGADDRNLKLSQGRSESVMNYIVSKGISIDRLKAKGFGETKPIDTNSTPEGRANNRRVEFTVLKT